MADLSAMYRATAESVPQPAEMMLGALGMQRIMNNGLEYQQARDNYEAMRGLRALFAKNANPSMADVGAISPAFAQEYGKNQFAMQRDLLGMQRDRAEIGKIEGQVTEQDAKAWAPIFGSIAEKYADGGNIDQFRAEIGQAIAQGQAQGLRLAPQFDINSLDPLTTLQRAQSLGYKSQYLESKGAAEKERAMIGVPPKPSPEQYYGSASIDPATAMPMRTPPVVGPGAQPGPEAWKPGGYAPRNAHGGPIPNPQAFKGRGGAQSSANVPTFDQVTDVKMLEDVYKQLPNGSPDKIAAGRRLQELIRGNDADASYNDEPDERFASPGEIRKERVKVAGDKAAAEAQAKADVDRKEGAATKLTILESIPPLAQIDALIDQSMSSGIESRIKGITSGEFGMQDASFTASEELKPIAAQLRSLGKGLAGAGAVSDYEQKLIESASGAIADPRVPRDARKAQLRVVLDIAQKAIDKYPDLAQRLKSAQGGGGQHTPRAQALIDAHKAKTISDEQFAKEWDALPDEEY